MSAELAKDVQESNDTSSLAESRPFWTTPVLIQPVEIKSCWWQQGNERDNVQREEAEDSVCEIDESCMMQVWAARSAGGCGDRAKQRKGA
jgi:hypothetical protein